MFDKFDPEAIKAIMLSQQEAAKFGHLEVGTEHLLLGLIAVEGSMARRLNAAGVNFQNARREVEKMVHCSAGRIQQAILPAETATEIVRRLNAFGYNFDVETVSARWQQSIPFSDAAKRTLEQSWQEARKASQNYVDSHHMLVGLIGHGENPCTRVLTNLGIDLNQLRG
jgi:ATP-dependent Clp protease ATP-binding subunit ClpC